MAAKCQELGAPSADVYAGTLSDFKDLDLFAKSIVEKFGCVDILVNNAGILGPMDKVIICMYLLNKHLHIALA